jgi:hypothetical protein
MNPTVFESARIISPKEFAGHDSFEMLEVRPIDCQGAKAIAANEDSQIVLIGHIERVGKETGRDHLAI